MGQLGHPSATDCVIPICHFGSEEFWSVQWHPRVWKEICWPGKMRDRKNVSCIRQDIHLLFGCYFYLKVEPPLFWITNVWTPPPHLEQSITPRSIGKDSTIYFHTRALWFWTFFEFHYGQAGSSVCYRNLEVWLYTGLLRSCWNPPRNYHRVWKIQQWLKKEDFSTFIDSFEINTPRQLFIQPCVTKTERYGYIWNYGGCVEPSHRTTIGCEKG